MSNASRSLLDYLRVASGAWRNDPRTDAELLTRFAENRDEDAFKVLVWRHGPMVWQACARVLGESPDSEDAFQTVFLALTRKASSLRREPLAGWLYRVARRAALKSDIKSRQRQNFEHQLQTVAQPKTPDPGQDELHKALNEELSNLPERLRVPLILRYLEEKSQDEVANFLGCSRSVARKRLTRGETLLRERLEQRGLALGALSVAAHLGDKSGIPMVPVGLMANTVRAAVAFRAGTLTGGTADAVEKLLRSLSLERAVGKCWWLLMVCAGAFGLSGAGLLAWKMFGDGSDAVQPVAPKSTAVEATVKPLNKRVDLYGDPLPKDAVARIGTVRFRAPGESVRRTDAGINTQFNVALSPGGNILISSHKGSAGKLFVRFWDIATGKQLREIVLNSDGDRERIALSRDGKILAAATSWCEVQLTDSTIGQSSGKILSASWPCVFTPDNKAIACWDTIEAGESFTLYDVSTRKPINQMRVSRVDKKSDFIYASFSEDSRFFACLEETGAVHLVVAKTGKEIATLKERQIVSLTFAPNGNNLVTAGKDKKIRVWDTKTGKEVRQLGQMAEIPTLVDFSLDGKTVLAACAGQICRWNITTGNESWHSLECKGLLSPQIFSADGMMLIERVRDTLSIWDANTGKEIDPGTGAPRTRMELLTFSPDGKNIATIGGRNGEVAEIQFWEAATGKQLGSLATPESMLNFWHLTWPLPHMLVGQAAAWEQGRTVGVRWTGFLQRVHTVEPNVCDGLRFLLDGQEVQARQGGRGGLELVDAATGKNLSVVPFKIEGPSNFTNCLALSTDHRILATHSFLEPAITLWEVLTGRKLYSFNLPEPLPAQSNDLIYDILVGFSPDDRLIVTQNWQTKVISLWEHVSGRLRMQLPAPPECLHTEDDNNNVAFSSDGRLIAISYVSGPKEERSIHIWDLAAGRECQCLQGHLAGATRAGAPRIVFSRDGRYLASSGMDYTVLVWKLRQPPVLEKLSQSLDQKELQTLKAAFIGVDAAGAYQAIRKLRKVPEQAVPLAAEYLRSQTPTPKTERIAHEVSYLIGDLDSDNYQTRMKSAEGLHKMLLAEDSNLFIESLLNKAMSGGKLSVEVNNAITKLLDELKQERSTELTRMPRAIELLELVQNDSAREVLQKVVAASPQPEVRRMAEMTLKRLANTRSSVVP